MEQKKYYYIRGNAEHPEKVKEALEKVGAVECRPTCECSESLYYIRPNGFVGAADDSHCLYYMLLDFGEELFIEPDYKFKVGDKVKIISLNLVGEVKSLFNDKGEAGYGIKVPKYNYLHHIPEDDVELYTEPKPQFQPYQKVLKRRSRNSIWIADLYSHCAEDEEGIVHVCVSGGYEDCIPYEGNEHLLGTTNNPE